MSTTAPAALRAVDMAIDLRKIVALITLINAYDKAGWSPSIDGLSHEWAASSAFDPACDLRALELDGTLIGLARHSWVERPTVVSHRLEVWVHPEHRRLGHGTALLRWAESSARAAVAENRGGSQGKPHDLAGGGPDSVVPTAGFAAANGFTAFRYTFEMRRPLGDPIPAAPLPDGIEVRPVAAAHHRTIWDANAEAFRGQWDHAEPVEGDFEQFFRNPDLDPTMWQVAWDGDEVAGLVMNTIHRQDAELQGERAGWIHGVATRRPWRKRGIAGALLARSLVVLREHGMDVAELGVDSENPAGALGLYERFGFKPRRRWVVYRKPF